MPGTDTGRSPPPSTRGARTRRRIGSILLVLSAGFIAVATLTPVTGPGTTGPNGFCVLICGERGLADSIANVLLFLPLGFSLGLFGSSNRRAALVGGAVAMAIELVQLSAVVGRDASVADVINNTVGVVLGAAVGRSWLLWVLPPAPRAGTFLSAAAAGVVTVMVATGLLLSPRLPEGSYGVHLDEAEGDHEAYSGSVLYAAIGSTPIPPTGGAVPGLRRLVDRGVPLTLRLQAGPPLDASQQILRIVRDSSQTLFLGAGWSDLQLHYHAWAGMLRLDQPSVRIRGALREMAPGDTFTVRLWRTRTGFCLEARSSADCAGYTVGSGWELLQRISEASVWVKERINFLWLALLFAPLGLWFRRTFRSAATVAAVVVAAAVTPSLVGLLPATVLDVAGATTGFLVGLAFQRTFAARISNGGRGAPTQKSRVARAD